MKIFLLLAAALTISTTTMAQSRFSQEEVSNMSEQTALWWFNQGTKSESTISYKGLTYEVSFVLNQLICFKAKDLEKFSTLDRLKIYVKNTSYVPLVMCTLNGAALGPDFDYFDIIGL